MISTIAFLNNPISAALAYSDFKERGIPLHEVALIMVRPFLPDWAASCAEQVIYPAKPSNSPFDQWRFINFYRAAAKLVRAVESSGNLKRIYSVNNDNLIAAHLFAAAERSQIELTVVVEGLMNFQDIGRDNRQNWRWRVKPVLSHLLGLEYHQPQGHLSGAFEPATSRIISFADAGLKAPDDKVVRIPFPKAEAPAGVDPKVALLPLTGLAQWMPTERAEKLAHSFRDWLVNQDFDELLVKPHPHSDAGIIGELLPPHTILKDTRSLEDMAQDLKAGTVVGTCCTGLVTLKLMRPDLECIDFGADFYQVHAYNGDTSVEALLRSSGVKLVALDQEKID